MISFIYDSHITVRITGLHGWARAVTEYTESMYVVKVLSPVNLLLRTKVRTHKRERAEGLAENNNWVDVDS